MKAKRLNKNSIIGVCAPSGYVKEKNKEELDYAQKLLKELDLEVKYSKNLYSNSLGYSATVEEKQEDINFLIKDKSVNAIAFAKGGNNANSILDLIDYEDIKKNPKIFFGFSDNTVLLNAIYKMTGLITYHFTNFKGLFESAIDFNKEQFITAFIHGYKGNVKHNSDWLTIREGKCTGKLIGGNLSSIVKILNTKYSPIFKNNILFIEALSLEDGIEEVSSLLYELKMNKVFDKISGLLIGNYDSESDIQIEDLVCEVTKDYNFPIIKCNDFGHTKTNIVLPIGIKCTMDADNCELKFEENTVR